MSSSSKAEFGLEMRQEFALEKETLFCNHGSYGAVPKRVLQKRLELLTECEAHPDKWFRGWARTKYEINLARAATFLGSDVKNLVFVTNPTTAINAIFNSMTFKAEDTILCYSHTYNAVKNIAEQTAQKWGCQVHYLELKLPIQSEDEIVDAFVNTCKNLSNVKIAIIDHISSASAIQFPVGRIVEGLKAMQVLTLVDGAHAPGQIANLALDQLKADFYTGTLHKWCYATKGTAILWVHPKHQSWVRPLVTSHNYLKGYQEEFFMQGTRDLTPYLCVEEALDFYQEIGGAPAIARHAEELLDFGEKLFKDYFDVASAPFPKSMRAPYMRIIGMPHSTTIVKYSFEIVEDLMVTLNQRGIAAQVTFFDEKPWIRLSAQVYNRLPKESCESLFDEYTCYKLMLTLLEEFDLVVAVTFFGQKAWIRMSANVYNCKEDFIEMRSRIANALKIQ